MKMSRWSPSDLLDAAWKRMEPRTAARELTEGAGRALRLMEKKLTPKRKEIIVPGTTGNPTGVFRTRFKGVFKQAASDDYLLSLPNGQIVSRSRQEIETHILLESYLREQYDDRTTRRKQVIRLQALDDDGSTASDAAPSTDPAPAARPRDTVPARPADGVTQDGLRIDLVRLPMRDRTLSFSESGTPNVDPVGSANRGQDVARIHDTLALSHGRQLVSGERDRCWLRTSWLPLLSTFSPEELEQKAAAMLCDPPKDATRHMPAILGAIARQYRNDPVAFVRNGQRQAGDRRAALADHARLGGALHAVPGYRSEWGRDAGESVEDYLKEIQVAIGKGAAIGESSNSIYTEVLRHTQADAKAASEMPVLLLRAFGLPALVIEERPGTIQSNGQASGRNLQVRALATEGSAAAEFIGTWSSATHQAIPLGSDVLPQLLEKYQNRFILWLKDEHYETYVPQQYLSPAAQPPARSS